jgi:hypothetical protein
MLPNVFSPEVVDLPHTVSNYVPTHSIHFKNVVFAWLVKILSSSLEPIFLEFNLIKKFWEELINLARGLLLVLASTAILGSESRRTYDHISLSHDSGRRENLV